ncbi:hypothetical protein GOB57_08975 [Sinorhizobium meliloti]|nr:hypothetical protein [Sinorhizobium meliloti]
MTDRALYFGILKKAFGALCHHSDPQVARSAGRFCNLYDLLDIKTRTGETPTIDRQNSGFPIHPEVVRIASDLRKGTLGTVRPSAEIVNEMLDEMIVGKRMPSAQLVEDMALTLYSGRIDQLGKGDSGADAVVGTSAVETFKRVFPREIAHDTREVRYEWDYWPATSSQPSASFARMELETEDAVSVEEWAKVETLRVAHGFTGAGDTLLSLAQALDKFQKARLKELVRITYTGIETPLFHSTSDDFHQRLAAVDDESSAWILRFHVEKLRSRGTLRKPGGVLRSEVLSEDFHVNVHRDETRVRQCSSFDRHALMSSSAYKAISDKKAFLSETTVHVVSDDGTVLNENI